jgi:hypothetical protein
MGQVGVRDGENAEAGPAPLGQLTASSRGHRWSLEGSAIEHQLPKEKIKMEQGKSRLPELEVHCYASPF